MKREYKYEWDILLLKCTKCGEYKDKDSFYKHKRALFWLASKCKECYKEYSEQNKVGIKEYKKLYYQKNKDKLLKEFKNYRLSHADKISAYKKEYSIKNKTELSLKNKKYYEENKEELLKKQKEYRAINKDKISDYYKKYYILNQDKLREYKCLYNRLNREKIADKKRKYRQIYKDKISQRELEYSNNRSAELWYDWFMFHENARRYAKKYNLKPSKCPICWVDDKIQIHHPSYERFENWKDVVFCCARCHQRIHSWILECPQPINLLTITN